MKTHISRISIWIIFLLGIGSLLLLPVVMAGFPYALPPIQDAQNFWNHGELSLDSQRLMPVIIAVLSPVIGWHNVVGWIVFNIAIFCSCLTVFWFIIRRLFDEKTAWISTLFFALFPLSWENAINMNGYVFAYAFSTFGVGALVALWPQEHYRHMAARRWLAVLIFSVLFGCAVASRDAFILLAPWIAIGYVLWQRSALWTSLLQGVAFCGIVFALYQFPLVVQVLQSDLPLVDRIALLRETRETGYGHFYPDQYTYEFEKEEYEELSAAEFNSSSWLERMEAENYRIVFGVDDFSLWSWLRNGTWLFFNQLPKLIMQETFGGVFLWLFILPGGVSLWKRNRALFVFMIGLMLGMELLLRFGFHYRRTHLMNISWIFAIAAAVGVSDIATALQQSWKKISLRTILVVIVIISSVQLVQANRKYIARRYTDSTAPVAYAAQDTIESLPADVLVAHPKGYREYFYFEPRRRIYFHPKTMQRIIESDRISAAFQHYGVTHIVGYSDKLTADIQASVPSIQVIAIVDSDAADITVTPLMSYLLHLVR